jgi:hypothetical protein
VICLWFSREKNSHPNNGDCFRYFDKSQRGEAINKADIVISMLPAHLHIEEIVWFIKEFGNGLVHKRSYARA